MPAPDVQSLRGHRVVAEPSQLDALVAALPAGTTALRFAPDELLVLDLASIRLDDPHAIVEPDVGWSAVTVDREVVERHTEWQLPPTGALGQGSIAGVPATLSWLPDGRAWIATAGEIVDAWREQQG